VGDVQVTRVSERTNTFRAQEHGVYGTARPRVEIRAHLEVDQRVWVAVSNADAPFLVSAARVPLYTAQRLHMHTEGLERPVATNEKPYAAHLPHRVEDSPVLRGSLPRTDAEPCQLRFARKLTPNTRAARLAVRNKSLRGA
jgi:hypothetical protein